MPLAAAVAAVGIKVGIVVIRVFGLIIKAEAAAEAAELVAVKAEMEVHLEALEMAGMAQAQEVQIQYSQAENIVLKVKTA